MPWQYKYCLGLHKYGCHDRVALALFRFVRFASWIAAASRDSARAEVRLHSRGCRKKLGVLSFELHVQPKKRLE